MDGRSKAEDDFRAFTREEMRGANLKNMRPLQELTKTLGGGDTMVELKSHEQTMFQTPNLAMAKSEKAAPPRPGLDIGGGVRSVRPATFYQREHGPAQVRLAQEMARRSASTPDLDRRGFPALNMDPTIFKIKRLPMMMPGK